MVFSINFSSINHIDNGKTYSFKEWVEKIYSDCDKALASTSTLKCLAAYKNALRLKFKHERHLSREQHDMLAVYISQLEDAIMRLSKQ